MSDMSQEDITTILNILKQIPLMADLNEEDHHEIIKHITLELYPPEHVIFNEGEIGDAFYIIKSGMVRVYHPAASEVEEVEVATLGNNDFFGEMALIGEKPRNASTKTVEETQCFRLAKDDFIQLVSSNPNMASRISKEFLSRLKINTRNENQG
ncbi:MAG TPA: cyclic nucleotide-binding domain-containing protein [Candidatus Gracilibacteria bacterium]|nr:cyclic nucleotide-binding domain-containing protein [Candidatus Gracilibacteria bacterium]